MLLELDEGREAVLYRDIIEASSEGGNAKPSFITTLQMAMAGSKDEGFLKMLLQLMYAQVEGECRHARTHGLTVNSLQVEHLQPRWL